jgi:GNAT superfamily N-acetyltransferase
MTEWCSQRLAEEHDAMDFRCGNDQLDAWLKMHALRAQQADTARTYVWTPRHSRRIVAYYSVAPTQILREEVTSSQAGGFSVVPAYLLARLALDRTLHGQGLGSELLVDALETIVKAARTGGGRLIVVDVIDDSAAAFYRRHDFQSIKGNARRLVMKTATARQALGLMEIRVTPDRETQLISIVVELPDGTAMPVVASVAETEAIGQRLMDLTDQAEGGTDVRINLSQVLREVLGRDPGAASRAGSVGRFTAHRGGRRGILAGNPAPSHAWRRSLSIAEEHPPWPSSRGRPV